MSNGKQTVIVRFDTEIQVELPACGECNGGSPCQMCERQAVEAAVSVIRGHWRVDSDYDNENEVSVFSDCSDADVIEVRVE